MWSMRQRETYLDDPGRGSLLAAKHPLCADNATGWIYCTVDDIHGNDMGTMGIGVFMPHPDDDMRPRVTEEVLAGVH
jgi:hypothetical protein